ncbi:MAG TPA: hypothetical protein VK745_22505 [Polyangiaceae bacterium]|jgi:hypothetical protein|nr:hypothetical protein [Polyangiaceae bacterium]
MKLGIPSFSLFLAVGCNLLKADPAPSPCALSVAGSTSVAASGSVGSGGSGVAGLGGADGGSTAGGALNSGNGGNGAAAATGGASAASGGSGTLPDSTACGQLPVAQCSGNANCAALSGQRIADSMGCVEALEVVACGTNQGCMPTPTRATDPTSMDWIFPSTCIPAGWSNSTSAGTRFDPCPTSSGGTSGGGGSPGGANGGSSAGGAGAGP